MDMMFVHDECLRNNVKPAIDFIRKFFVSMRKQLSQFFIWKAMINYTGR